MSAGAEGRSGLAAEAKAVGEGSTLRRVVFGALVGTALEWYDFFIYGTAAALVFGQLFFPGFSDVAGTMAAFATFGVAFLVRPLGGFIFGHMGDRIGRRETLIVTTLLMGLSTGLIGLLPTYEAIGVWAPVLLTLLRICQGLGAGAEFGGASTLLAEHAPQGRRGFYCSFSQMGVQVGLVSGTLMFLLVGLLPDEQLFSWGWRVPFLLGFVLIAVALYVRLRVEESPVFRRMESTRQTVRMPVLEALRRYPRNFLIGIGAHICDTALAYFYATYTVSYLTSQLGLSRSVALGGVVLYGIVVILLQPVYGALSDRIGRRPINIFSVVFSAAFAFPFFMLINTGVPALIWLALIVATALGWAPMIAVQGAFYSELFGARVRYTGFAASRELGAALAGFTPLIFAALVGITGDAWWLAAGFMILLAFISLVAFYFAAEGKDLDIAELDPVHGRSA
ncbi:Fosfomycin resistance protein AbaF [Rubrobacter xylanophilus DSM 9941]|uniref:MFS transporter n=1 Tax=Rubrobacter xylanophilus TaxID=49319 RepID=UPI001C640263|nr:MFS transporter [Rubrobacter xylanophilus]QYJ16288.1 Fosfomycin resistance protein AbaF [Rubrobacter xylanophilus DSM 9941]